MELEEALELLRSPEHGGIDLTGQNVQELKDKKSRHVLEPLLQKVLPRRQLGQEHSSYYRELRVKLLPVNPYFKRDVSELRKLLRIPESQITAIDITQFPNRMAPWDKGDTLETGTAVGVWLRIHRSNALKTEMHPLLPPVPQWLCDSASTRLKPGRHAPLSWLRKKPEIPDRHAHRFDLKVPLDWCAARLIERYELPWYCKYSLYYFILTQEGKYLEKILPFDVTVVPITTPVGGAFTITIDWIDEYTTKKQWGKIFDNYITPRQEHFWEERGDLPHSKHINPDKLKQPWVVHFYQFLFDHEMSGQKVGVDKAMDLVTREDNCPPEIGQNDRTVLQRYVKRLETLCRPQE